MHYTNNVNYNAVHVHAGFPEWILFSAFVNLISPHLTSHSKLPKLASIVMFFLKLHLNLFDEDIGYRFGVRPSTVSRNFHQILDVAATKTSFLINWPDRDVLRLTMPMSFQRFFRKCCVIIDCTEVFIERPSDLLARA